MFTCDLQTSQTQVVRIRRTNKPHGLYTPPFPVGRSQLFFPVACNDFISSTLSPLHFPVISGAPFLLWIELHSICITLGQCFLIEHRRVALLLLVGIRYRRIARDNCKRHPYLL